MEKQRHRQAAGEGREPAAWTRRLPLRRPSDRPFPRARARAAQSTRAQDFDGSHLNALPPREVTSRRRYALNKAISEGSCGSARRHRKPRRVPVASDGRGRPRDPGWVARRSEPASPSPEGIQAPADVRLAGLAGKGKSRPKGHSSLAAHLLHVKVFMASTYLAYKKILHVRRMLEKSNMAALRAR